MIYLPCPPRLVAAGPEPPTGTATGAYTNRSAEQRPLMVQVTVGGSAPAPCAGTLALRAPRRPHGIGGTGTPPLAQVSRRVKALFRFSALHPVRLMVY